MTPSMKASFKLRIPVISAASLSHAGICAFGNGLKVNQETRRRGPDKGVAGRFTSGTARRRNSDRRIPKMMKRQYRYKNSTIPRKKALYIARLVKFKKAFGGKKR
jgi:hypothetical protein